MRPQRSVRRIGLLLVLLVLLVPFVLGQQIPNRIDLMDAIAQAQALYPGAQLIEAELTRWDDGTPAWDIKLDNGMAIYIDEANGRILEIEPWGRQLRQQRERHTGPPPWAGFPGGRRAWEAQQLRPAPERRPLMPPHQPEQVVPRGSMLDLQQALAIALSQFPNAQLIEAELTRWDRRKQAWDIKLDNGFAVYVDARTGRILEVEAWR